MKVSELINLLKTLPQDHIVVMSSDGEGNSFSPFADIGLGEYTPDSTWGGDFASDNNDDPNYKENAVALWPTN